MAQHQATYEDAELLLKLYDVRREERLRTARAWFLREFSASTFGEAMEKYPPGSDHNAYYRMVVSYWDMAASFVVRGILHDELFFENSTEMLVVWEKIKAFAEDFRRIRGNPLIYRNLQKGAEKHAEWLSHNSPTAYAGIQALANPKK